MGEDYGDMMRRSAEKQYRDSLLREYGHNDDPASHAVELAEGRKAIQTLKQARHGWALLRGALGGSDA